MELGMDRSFHAQPTVQLVRNKSAKQAVAKRYTKKSVGFGIKNPAFAKQGDFIDKKCPFTGNVSIRGRLLTGVGKLKTFYPLNCINLNLTFF